MTAPEDSRQAAVYALDLIAPHRQVGRDPESGEPLTAADLRGLLVRGEWPASSVLMVLAAKGLLAPDRPPTDRPQVPPIPFF